MEKVKDITASPKGANSDFHCGTVALAGRSNVGKSTLLNRVLGTKLAIVAEKPQVTRSRILGIRTRSDAQMIWVDLPGIHRPRSLLNERMVQTARRSVAEADVVVVVIDAKAGLVAGDGKIAELAAARGCPWLFVVNKIDLARSSELLSLVSMMGERFRQIDVVPVSARTGENVAELEQTVARLLPVGPALYPEDELTDQTARMIVQEVVREKIFEATEAEIPYQAAVIVESFEEKPNQNLNVVQATVLVERETQKRILIGKGGAMIREIGRRARLDLEAFFGVRFFLELFVKVRPDWTKSPRILDELGM